MSAGAYGPVVACGETPNDEPFGTARPVRSRARHSAVPGVAAGQAASTLATGAPAARTVGGAVSREDDARPARTTHRVSPSRIRGTLATPRPPSCPTDNKSTLPR